MHERVSLLRELAALLTARGVVVLVTTVAADHLFSRHLDLELRAHRAGRELPDVDDLADRLPAAGLGPEQAPTLLPGQPLVAVLSAR